MIISLIFFWNIRWSK